MRSRSVIVVGPHRSGTSVVTRVISLLGLDLELCLPEDRMFQPDNPAGHWESVSISALNDELLDRLGGTWYAPPELEGEWVEDLRLEGFVERAQDAFSKVHREQGWLWKDPRLCLVLPFWSKVHGEADPVIVVSLRDAGESAASLSARDGWGRAHALAIWEWNVVELLRSLASRSVVVIRYRDLLQRPESETKRLRTDLMALGIGESKGSGEGAVATASSFVDPNLWRQKAMADGRLESQRALEQILVGLEPRYESFPHIPVEPSAWVKELLEGQRLLARAAGLVGGSGGLDLAIAEDEEGVETVLADRPPRPPLASQLELGLEAVQSRRSRRASALSAARRRIQTLEVEVEAANEWAHGNERDLLTARDRLGQIQTELQSSNQWALELDGELERARERLDALHQQLNASNEWARHNDSELRTALDRIEELHNDLKASNDWALRVDADLQQARERIEALQAELEASNAWAASIDSELESARLRIEELTARPVVGATVDTPKE